MERIKKYMDAGLGEKRSVTEMFTALEENGYHCHHFALRRGYVRSERGFITAYSGKYGNGYIVNCPNNISTGSKRSNNYHEIAYFTNPLD